MHFSLPFGMKTNCENFQLNLKIFGTVTHHLFLTLLSGNEWQCEEINVVTYLPFG
jgi:hypothetical protein